MLVNTDALHEVPVDVMDGVYGFTAVCWIYCHRNHALTSDITIKLCTGRVLVNLAWALWLMASQLGSMTP